MQEREKGAPPFAPLQENEFSKGFEMAAYENMRLPVLPGYVGLTASIARIDAVLSVDTIRWCLSPQNRGPGHDFKQGKLDHYAKRIAAKDGIEAPEFFLAGRGPDIMDGRHRIYALHDAGFTHLLICCKSEDRVEIQRVLGSASE